MSDRKILYHPSGRAGAYANNGYAANIFKGCTHGCRYCYVPDFLHMNADKREIFRTIVTPAPNVLARMEKNLKRNGKIEEPIFLCFTCDPYPVDPKMYFYTRTIIELILKSDNCVNILTKAGMTACMDFDLLEKDRRNKIGATLTFYDEELARKWEPRASRPLSRVDMLRTAKESGITTWASIEPVIVPEESLRIMDYALPYVDEFKIGKWNHDVQAERIDWKKFVHDAVALMEKYNKKYVLKEDLKKYL
jgi:DNA repair photolyase